MMRDGIYKVYLDAGGAKGFIIGAMRDGHITGCDQTHFITGRFSRRGNRVKGSFIFKRHSRRSDFREIANLDDFETPFSGVCSDSFGQLEAAVPERPGLKVVATFRWVCEV